MDSLTCWLGELGMEIDWMKAPRWAQYHACDANGEGFFYDRLPFANVSVWLCLSKRYSTKFSGYTLPDGMDWRQSLTKREEKQHV